MNGTEFRASVSLALVFSARLLGLFMIYPVFATEAVRLRGATPETIGLALGAYGLAQGLLQIPLGLLSDRIGRKTVIVLGLILFGFGSVVAALATSIEGVLLGRVLQGAGAVGSTILALVADLTREEVRTRAMALVGVTIGLSFAVAVVIGPPLAALVGLSGIFWTTMGLALVGVAITLWVTPNPAGRSRAVAPHRLWRVLSDGELLRLDFAIFALHAVLTASFLVLPQLLAAALHLPPGGEWELYLPVMAVSVALMVPAIVVAETRGRMKEVFLAAIVSIAASLAMLAGLRADAAIAIAALTIFFTGFNAMEALLPSLITKFAPADARGAATGVYSSSQFLGIFVGGAAGGWLLEAGGGRAVLAAGVGMGLVWLLVAAGMRRPRASGAPGAQPVAGAPTT
ncbi:MAG TPA: MFS transporter [Caulobacteraceae bacterium]|nr:MFS transporter [Caulobacteraceae bacterium]